MKLGVLFAAGLAAALTAGCSETGRRGSGYERSTVIVDSRPRYDYRVPDRREWDRRERWRETRDYRREARRDDRRAERREDRRDDRRERERAGRTYGGY